MTLLLYTAVTWLELACLAFVFALLLFRLPAFSPPAFLVLRNDSLFPSSIWLLFGAAVVLIILTTTTDLVARGIEMSGTSFPAVLSVLPTVLLRTHFGTLWLLRLSCLFLLILLIGIQQVRDAAAGRYLMMTLTVIIAWTQSASGHASDSGDLTLKEMMDLIHLLAISVWAGGVMTLAFVVLPSFKRQADILPVTLITRRFSQVAGYAVGFVLVTAIYNMRVYVGEFSALWKTPYGLAVLAKILLLYFLLLIGALNRYLGLPLLEHAAGGRFTRGGLIMQLIDRVLTGVRGHLSLYVINLFRKIVTVEALLMLVVILGAAALKHLTPPSHMQHEHRKEMRAPPAPAPPDTVWFSPRLP